MLLGRRNECAALDQLLEAVRAGESRALVLRGEAGVGKSALLGYLQQQSAGCRVARAVSAQSEMELPFAGLHQLCAPILDRLGSLPGPQRDALCTAFGLSAGDPPDRFFVGLAVLSLLAEAAQDQPLLCLVDDAQWLDEVSSQALAFVARRLSAESVALVFAVRAPDTDPAEPTEPTGLHELRVRGLNYGDAKALLGSAIRGPLDEQVRDRIVAETRGNPLALLELPRGSTPAELAGGFGLPDAQALEGRIEESFQRRLEVLPSDSRLLLLVAAAEPLGEPVLVWRAAERLGIAPDAALPAEVAGLFEIGARVRFRHPLVRSAVYLSASPEDRRSVHAALADATDGEVDPDRRAWHRAQATAGPDGDVAAELERSAGRAQARGGVAAAAAFLERASALTPEPSRRAERALAAAEAKFLAGAPDAALGLLAAAQAGKLDELHRARVDLLRAQVEFASTFASDAPRLLFAAAMRLEPLDIALARATYLDALCATVYIGPLAGGCDPLDVAKAALAAARPLLPSASDLMLDGLALLITEGYAAAVPTLRRALAAFDSDDLPTRVGLGFGWLACYIASTLWEHEIQYALAVRFIELAREAGQLAMIPPTVAQLVGIHLRNGELSTAAALMQEAENAVQATASEAALQLSLALAAYQGRESEVRALIAAGDKQVRFRDSGIGLVVVQWASTLLFNGLGRYEEAVRAALRAQDHVEPIGKPPWTLPELIEAAARSGAHEEAADAFRRLSAMTQVSGTGWALGLEARCRALLSDGAEAERLYREAIQRLGEPGSSVDLARAHLVYGEWLRGEGRRRDARDELRTAHEMLSSMGVQAFADRAARELAAAGETARTRGSRPTDKLTAQESQVARLARDGLSNPEIGARLFISPRTVEYHLHKVFAKHNIRSRNDLARVLSGDPSLA
jgi:DNA-binding CsgD family transcriptional regulator